MRESKKSKGGGFKGGLLKPPPGSYRVNKLTSNVKCNMIVGCIDRPPSFSLDIVNERLSILFNQIDAEHKYAYITGDFNCNTLPGCDSSISTDDFKNIFFS